MSGAGGRDGSNGKKRTYVKNDAERAEDRADWRWLNARGRGDRTLPAHDPARIAEYLRMEAALAELPERLAPEGWSDAVLAEAERRDAARSRALDLFDASEGSGTGWRDDEPVEPRCAGALSRNRWPRVAAASLAMVAAALLWLVLRGQPERHSAPLPVPVIASVDLDQPRVKIVRGHARAGEAAPTAVGDTFIATLLVPAGDAGELRLYRDDREVVARCPGTPGCATPVEPGLPDALACTQVPMSASEPAERAPARPTAVRAASQCLSLRLRLLAPGSYRVVYLEGAALGEPSGDFDRDLARCGCEVKMLSPVSVK